MYWSYLGTQEHQTYIALEWAWKQAPSSLHTSGVWSSFAHTPTRPCPQIRDPIYTVEIVIMPGLWGQHEGYTG